MNCKAIRKAWRKDTAEPRLQLRSRDYSAAVRAAVVLLEGVDNRNIEIATEAALAAEKDIDFAHIGRI
ncbi:MAG TPA: hypothetical protein VHC90_19025, partial [Bryobacteraceae bacterium]|nr:hypothetical protein [Bryobacteraceae bacterium]